MTSWQKLGEPSVGRPCPALRVTCTQHQVGIAVDHRAGDPRQVGEQVGDGTPVQALAVDLGRVALDVMSGPSDGRDRPDDLVGRLDGQHLGSGVVAADGREGLLRPLGRALGR